MPYQSTRNPGFVASLTRGLSRRCPRCGEGKMFSGYLSVRHDCATCGMEFEPLRSDDAAPYFTLVVVLHVIISLYLTGRELLNVSLWAQAAFWCGLTLVMTMALLPFIKGGVMAVIFTTKAKG